MKRKSQATLPPGFVSSLVDSGARSTRYQLLSGVYAPQTTEKCVSIHSTHAKMYIYL